MSIKHGLNEAYSTKEAKNFHLGQGGYTLLAEDGDGFEHIDLGHYIAFIVLTDNCTVTTSVLHEPEAETEIIQIQDFPKGVMIYGVWERVSIRKSTSGGDNIRCIVYKG